jgi:S-formylglutathione hydrolase FrmB
MAAIAATSMGGTGARVVTRTTLGASDTFTYNASKNPILILDNVTGGALTPNIDGAGGTSVPVKGVGDVSVSSGLTLASIASGACVAIPLATIDAYLQGVITVTGGSGIKASLLEQ